MAKKSEAEGRLVLSRAEARARFNYAPSKETLEKIREDEINRALAYERLKDTLIGYM